MRWLTAKFNLEPIDISCESEPELAAWWDNIFAINKYFNVHWHVLQSAALPAFPVYFSVRKVCSCEKVSLRRFPCWREGDGVCVQTSRTRVLTNIAPPKPAPLLTKCPILLRGWGGPAFVAAEEYGSSCEEGVSMRTRISNNFSAALCWHGIFQSIQ